jgi:hypothetical protein
LPMVILTGDFAQHDSRVRSEYKISVFKKRIGINCFNRPFDDQSQERIAHETAAVFAILQRIIDGVDQLIWSAILTFETAQHPDCAVGTLRGGQRCRHTTGGDTSPRINSGRGCGRWMRLIWPVPKPLPATASSPVMTKSSGERGGYRLGSACPIPRTIYRRVRMSEQLTDEALRAKGLAVLEEHLGPVHTLRFLALISRESFDYQDWRQQHFGAMDLEEILAQAQSASANQAR